MGWDGTVSSRTDTLTGAYKATRSPAVSAFPQSLIADSHLPPLIPFRPVVSMPSELDVFSES